MKAVILAGGLGTRLSEETQLKPKPMIEIGGKPILWHIMKIYSYYGIDDFIICCGYKGFIIKEYFANYFLHNSDITFDIANQTSKIHENTAEPWRVTLVDTGENTMTGGRLKRVQKYIGNSRFCLTYGDGVADINISRLIQCHQANNALVTVSAVQPPGRFGTLDITEAGRVNSFIEKPKGDGAWINAGFFVMEPSFLQYLDNDATALELEPLNMAAKQGRLSAYKHRGFWQAVDTLRDLRQLNDRWEKNDAPWKLWLNGGVDPESATDFSPAQATNSKTV